MFTATPSPACGSSGPRTDVLPAKPGPGTGSIRTSETAPPKCVRRGPAGLRDPLAGIPCHPHPPGPCRTLPPEAGPRRPLPAAAGGGDAEWQRPAWAAIFGRLLPLRPPLGLRPGAADPRLLPPSPVRVRRGQIQAAARKLHREPGWGRLHAPGSERPGPDGTFLKLLIKTSQHCCRHK
ncbi:LHFPL tetraspan subfamily member 2 protein isoform X2 [Mesocricetus auratus]|uniref:LHFPL tetraspan subfamily member 2 protein isoform X2 n=1 Tax=Mesocricetus auratus TaxID=10036 RepID=A0ABM2W9P3_MESAU|nr:LHFPL tetraspan subfamily member 2 protein isoform X2 [Mesocricetus auratus]